MKITLYGRPIGESDFHYRVLATVTSKEQLSAERKKAKNNGFVGLYTKEETK